MKVTIIVTALAAAFAGPVWAHGANNKRDHPHLERPHVHERTTIVVSCFRGPWKDVIWDRPNSNFVDSLVNAGYTYPTAHAIAERVCRDDSLVGNPGAMKAAMERIFHDAASHRNRNH
ncbi:hypothetical protein ACOXXX_03655 [Thalassococcus sp. BH17M4-6]|uniref:hypothetical protein n=1 Tax=Thalassococcus sp. BH17M4-6 TaxID=3413148 RepID=UPI003BBD5017